MPQLVSPVPDFLGFQGSCCFRRKGESNLRNWILERDSHSYGSQVPNKTSGQAHSPWGRPGHWWWMGASLVPTMPGAPPLMTTTDVPRHGPVSPGAEHSWEPERTGLNGSCPARGGCCGAEAGTGGPGAAGQGSDQVSPLPATQASVQVHMPWAEAPAGTWLGSRQQPRGSLRSPPLRLCPPVPLSFP